MGLTIKDGATGKTAKVDANQRIRTATISEPERDHASESGDKYNINTGNMTITSAVTLTTLYIKNNETSDLIITDLIYNLGNTTGGNGDVQIDVIRNPTSGDIITNQTAADIPAVNQNHGSNKTLTADIYKGAVGDAVVTGGSKSISTRSAANTGRIAIALGAVVLQQGSSLAINYSPASSNTSQIVQFAAACYLKTSEVADVS